MLRRSESSVMKIPLRELLFNFLRTIPRNEQCNLHPKSDVLTLHQLLLTEYIPLPHIFTKWRPTHKVNYIVYLIWIEMWNIRWMSRIISWINQIKRSTVSAGPMELTERYDLYCGAVEKMTEARGNLHGLLYSLQIYSVHCLSGFCVLVTIVVSWFLNQIFELGRQKDVSVVGKFLKKVDPDQASYLINNLIIIIIVERETIYKRFTMSFIAFCDKSELLVGLLTCNRNLSVLSTVNQIFYKNRNDL